DSMAVAVGVEVFRAAADEFMTGFPLRVMAECLGVTTRPTDQARLEIAGLLRGDIGHGTIDPVLGAAERLQALTEQLAVEHPLALIIEDLHWADDASVALLIRLSRLASQVPLLIVGTCRPVPARRIIDRLRSMVDPHRAIELGPLDGDAVGELVT